SVANPTTQTGGTSRWNRSARSGTHAALTHHARKATTTRTASWTADVPRRRIGVGDEGQASGADAVMKKSSCARPASAVGREIMLQAQEPVLEQVPAQPGRRKGGRHHDPGEDGEACEERQTSLGQQGPPGGHGEDFPE